MNDRELLELAAKAAGLRSHRYCEAWNAVAAYTLQDGYYGACWNPLEDDGDALRLAAALYIHITISEYHRTVCKQGDDHRSVVAHNNDRARATRRAVVMVAAAVGEAMP